MKRLLYILGGLFSIIIVLALVAPLFVDLNSYKSEIEEQINTATGFDVVIEDSISLSLLPMPKVSVSGLRIAHPDSNFPPVMTMKRADVSVAFMPMLSGSIEIGELRLQQPRIQLVKNANGNANWETETLMDGKDKASDSDKDTSSDSGMDISFDRVEIIDASLSYSDEAQGASYIVEDLNLELSGKSLYGPYNIEGDVKYNNIPLAFTAKTKNALDLKNMSQPIELDVLLENEAIEVSYKGSVRADEKASAQGLANVVVSSARELASLLGTSLPDGVPERFEANTIVSATADKADIEIQKASFDGASTTGRINVAMSPLTVKATLRTESLKLPAGKVFASSKDKSSSWGGSSANAAASKAQDFLPETITLPAGMSVAADYTVGTLTVGDQSYKNVVLKANLSDKQRGGTLNIAQLPGGGTLRVDSSLTAGSSAVDNGQVVLRKPTVNTSFDLNSVNPAMLAKSYDPLMDIGEALKKALTSKGSVTIGYDNISANSINVKSGDLQGVISANLDPKAILVNVDGFGGKVLIEQVVSNGALPTSLDNAKVQLKYADVGTALKDYLNMAPYFKGQALDLYTTLSVPVDMSSVNIGDIKGILGKTNIAGTLSVNDLQSVPNIKTDLVLGALDLGIVNEASSTPQSSGSGAARSGSGDAVWSSAPIDMSWMHSIAGDVNITAQSIKAAGWTFDQPVLKAALSKGALDVNSFKAGVFGGQIDAKASLSTLAKSVQDKTPGMKFSTDYSFKDANLESIASAFMGSQLIKASGGLDALSGRMETTGRSQADLVSALVGDVNLSASDVIMKGFDVGKLARALASDTKPGDAVSGIFGSAFKGGQTAFTSIQGKAPIKNGVVSLDQLDLNGEQTSIATSGSIDLPKWRINTKHTFKLTNIEGAEELPSFDVKFSGPLNNPTQTFAEGLFQDYLNRKLKRKLNDVIQNKIGDKAIGKVLGGLLGGGVQAPAAQPQAPEQADGGSTESAPTQKQQKPDPAKAFEGLIKGLVR